MDPHQSLKNLTRDQVLGSTRFVLHIDITLDTFVLSLCETVLVCLWHLLEAFKTLKKDAGMLVRWCWTFDLAQNRVITFRTLVIACGICNFESFCVCVYPGTEGNHKDDKGISSEKCQTKTTILSNRKNVCCNVANNDVNTIGETVHGLTKKDLVWIVSENVQQCVISLWVPAQLPQHLPNRRSPDSCHDPQYPQQLQFQRQLSLAESCDLCSTRLQLFLSSNEHGQDSSSNSSNEHGQESSSSNEHGQESSSSNEHGQESSSSNEHGQESSSSNEHGQKSVLWISPLFSLLFPSPVIEDSFLDRDLFFLAS